MGFLGALGGLGVCGGWMCGGFGCGFCRDGLRGGVYGWIGGICGGGATCLPLLPPFPSPQVVAAASNGPSEHSCLPCGGRCQPSLMTCGSYLQCQELWVATGAGPVLPCLKACTSGLGQLHAPCIAPRTQAVLRAMSALRVVSCCGWQGLCTMWGQVRDPFHNHPTSSQHTVPAYQSHHWSLPQLLGPPDSAVGLEQRMGCQCLPLWDMGTAGPYAWVQGSLLGPGPGATQASSEPLLSALPHFYVFQHSKAAC